MVLYQTIGPMLLLLMAILPSFQLSFPEEGGGHLFDYKDLEEAFI